MASTSQEVNDLMQILHRKFVLNEDVILEENLMDTLKSIIYEDMNNEQLEAYLTSQTQKEVKGITVVQSKSLEKFWKQNRNTIRSNVLQSLNWNSVLETFNWKVCLRSGVITDRLTEPVVTLQLTIKEGINNTLKNVEFDLNSQNLELLIKKLKEADLSIKNFIK